MIKINLYVTNLTWIAFRVACLQRKTSASKEIDRLMREQLDRWEGNAPLTIQGGRPGETYRISYTIPQPLNNESREIEHEQNISIEDDIT